MFADDQNAVGAMLAALENSGKPFIYTSGSGVVTCGNPGELDNRVFDEEMPFIPLEVFTTRVATEKTVLAAATREIRTMVLRPGIVYGRGGVVPILRQLLEAAQQRGVAPYVGRGENIWSNVHVDDLADLYVLALENGPAGALFNAASGETTLKAMAESISHLLGLSGKTESWSIEQASEKWGPIMAREIASNSRVTGGKARKLLEWTPTGASLLKEIEHGSYHNQDICI